MSRNPLETYYDSFASWEDVASNFGTTTPEPDKVFFAGYVQPSYEGDALVVYRDGDKYYTVDGSHCSCFGLEGQWKPEEYDQATFLALIDRKIESGNGDTEYVSYRADVWRFIKAAVLEERSAA